eukprot:scaffold1319_cov126-Cylindrotheca_fusiformis.AAC.8
MPVNTNSLIRYFLRLVDGKGGVMFDVLFGPAYKGISLGAVTAAALYRDFGVDVGYAYNRKEAKDHGEGGKLVGAPMSDGKRVLVIDDVITAGTAIRESHEMLSSIGAKMIGVVIALDRAEKRSLDDPVSAVQAVERDLSVSVTSIVNLPQLQLFLEKSPDYGEDVLATVSKYRSQYGVIIEPPVKASEREAQIIAFLFSSMFAATMPLNGNTTHKEGRMELY